MLLQKHGSIGCQQVIKCLITHNTMSFDNLHVKVHVFVDYHGSERNVALDQSPTGIQWESHPRSESWIKT